MFPFLGVDLISGNLFGFLAATALQRMLERLRGYVSSSPYERSRSRFGGWISWEAQRGVNDLDNWGLRLEELGVSGHVSNPRLSDGGRMVWTVEERDLGLAEIGNEQSMEIGWERMRLESERIDGRAVEGQPWSWFQQSPETRESIMGEMRDSNWAKGILRVDGEKKDWMCRTKVSNVKSLQHRRHLHTWHNAGIKLEKIGV
jgi:hypothetical protein